MCVFYLKLGSPHSRSSLRFVAFFTLVFLLTKVKNRSMIMKFSNNNNNNNDNNIATALLSLYITTKDKTKLN